ncbi:uncharacterized protein PSFLO_04137 [Pseudozyma flocculosa]|uniref:PH domain-containing protein n=1 Tax=Pseudozyma flocculosa TaxID=84751 RepID=A0A5C3F2K3_9BASI|nr:uncharacterized protein PSFLO_04137 [Pseudozyma flocculosa]
MASAIPSSSSQSSALSLADSADDELFEFPQPPPRIQGKDVLLSRPSLPALRTAYTSLSPGTGDLVEKRPSVPFRDHGHAPGSTLQSIRLASSHKDIAMEGSSVWDFYSPAVSDANSADTDHSGISLAPSLSSDAETHGPLTPGTPNSSGSGWRPKELNLVRRRERAISGEASMPSYHASRSWQSAAERNQTVGLGIAAPLTTPASAFPAYRAAPMGRGRGSVGAAAAPNGSGPRDLLLCSSGPLPSTKRFQGPMARSRENSFSSALGGNELSKGWTGPLPVLPSTPAFTSVPPHSFESEPSTRANSITAEEFVARVASQSDMHPFWAASGESHIERGLSADWLSAGSGYDPDQPPLSAVSTTTFDHRGLDEDSAPYDHGYGDGTPWPRVDSPQSGPSQLGPVSSGFSQAISQPFSKRRAPPARLVLDRSPRTDRGEASPSSAANTVTSARPDIEREAIAGQTTASSGSASSGPKGPMIVLDPTQSDEEETDRFDEPLKTAFYDFETSDSGSEAESGADLDAFPEPIRRNTPGVAEAAESSARDVDAELPPNEDSRPSTATADRPSSAHFIARVENRLDEADRKAEAGSKGFLECEQAKGMPTELLEDEDGVDLSGEERILPNEPLSAVEADEMLQAAEMRDELQQLPGDKQQGLDDPAWAASKSLSRLSQWMQQPESRTAFRVSIFAPDATSPTEIGGKSFADLFVDPKDTTGFAPEQDLPRGSGPSAEGAYDSPTDPGQGRTFAVEQRRAELLRMLDCGHDLAKADPTAEGLSEEPTAGRDEQKLPPLQFAINNLPAMSSGILSAPATVNIDQHPASFASSLRMGERAANQGMSSRWSSGSESDGASVASGKSVRRKSASKNGKKLSLSTKRKSGSAAANRESLGRPALSSPALSDAGPGFASASKARLSSQSKSLSAAGGKKSLLSSWAGKKRKELPEAWRASRGGSQVSTPGSTTVPSSPASDDRHAFPFPRVEASVAMAAAENAKAPRATMAPPPPPREPSPPPTRTMTTQQILEQARNNVWPERYGARAMAMREPLLRDQISVPVLQDDQDAYRAALQPHRAAPSAQAAAAAAAAASSSSTSARDILSEISELDRGRPSISSVQKSLPPLPSQEAQGADAADPRSSLSSRTSSHRLQSMASSLLPPRNLRHARQASSMSFGAGQQQRAPGDGNKVAVATRPRQMSIATACEADVEKGSAGSASPASSADATPRNRPGDLPETQLPNPAVDGPGSDSASARPNCPKADVETQTGNAAGFSGVGEDQHAPAGKTTIGRRKAKARKVRAIGLSRDDWPHRTSMTDYGRAWLREQGSRAFDALDAERIAFVQTLSASGAGRSRSRVKISESRREASTGSDGGSGSEDTDDYGSSDGGGGGGVGGGAGGGHPGDDGDDDDSDDDERSDDDDDDEDDDDDDEDEDDDISTEEESEDDYGNAEDEDRAARRANGTSGPLADSSTAAGNDSDSSDDRPLGELVQDPQALQRALREQERRKHIESSRTALENGPARATSQRTLKKMAAKAARQKAMMQLQEAQPNGGESSEASMDLADLTRRLMRVQSRRAAAPSHPAIPDPAAAAGFAPTLTSSTDSDRPLGTGALSRARSMNRPQADDAGVLRGKSLRTRPSESGMQAKSRGPSGGPVMPGPAPNLPNNAAATVAAAQKALTAAQANPTAANRAHAKAMAAAATAAMEVLTRPKRSATLAGASAPYDASAVPALAVAAPPNAGANLVRHRTEVRPAGRGDPRRPSHPATSMPPFVAPGAEALAAAAAEGGMSPEGVSPALVGNRPRAASRARAHLPSVNTAVAPPVPELNRLVSPMLRSPGLSSPLTPSSATFASQQQHFGQRAADSTDNEALRDGFHAAAAAAVSPSADESGGRPSFSGVIPPRMSSSSPASSPVAPPVSLSNEPSVVASHRARYKVYIMNKQRFTMAEIAPTARARELVLDVIEREQVALDESKGGWVVFDCSPDYGIERPLREYEIIHEVADTRANVDTDHFLLKRTELSPYLSIRAVPTSSPALAGYVYVQDKKKKWSKRWLELRDHALYHAKSEKGKDEAIICQMSNFDVYLVDPIKVKAPKAHAFALRSQDKITMFEKPDQDYVHYFALSDPAAHRDWVRAIMNARTYILRQERAVLFKPPPIASALEGPSGGVVGLDSVAMGPTRSAASNGGLSRRNTARRPGGRGNGAGPSAGPTPAVPGVPSDAPPPLIQPEVPPLISREAFSGPFEKGSLLADIAIKNASEAMRSVPVNTFAAQEARRREEAIERQRRLRTEGQPLIDLSKR